MKFFIVIFLTVLMAGCDESSELKKCKDDLQNSHQLVRDANQIFKEKDRQIEELNNLIKKRESYINDAGKIIAHLKYCTFGKVAILCDSEKIKQAETLLNKGFGVANDLELAKLYTVTILIFLLPFLIILMIYLGWLEYQKSGLKSAKKQIADDSNLLLEKKITLERFEAKINQREKDFNLLIQEKKQLEKNLVNLKKSIDELQKEIIQLEKKKKSYSSIASLGKF